MGFFSPNCPGSWSLGSKRVNLDARRLKMTALEDREVMLAGVQPKCKDYKQRKYEGKETVRFVPVFISRVRM